MPHPACVPRCIPPAHARARSAAQVGVRHALHVAAAQQIPWVPVHHMEAHALMAAMPGVLDGSSSSVGGGGGVLNSGVEAGSSSGSAGRMTFPALLLLASGGHNMLVSELSAAQALHTVDCWTRMLLSMALDVTRHRLPQPHLRAALGPRRCAARAWAATPCWAPQSMTAWGRLLTRWRACWASPRCQVRRPGRGVQGCLWCGVSLGCCHIRA